MSQIFLIAVCTCLELYSTMARALMQRGQNEHAMLESQYNTAFCNRIV